MVAPLIPEDPGLLASVGRYLGRFAQVPMNLLSGDIGGAFRQGADILGDTVDAFLPGDLIPEFSRPEDEKKPSKMLGINQDDSLLAGGVDFVGETLLNPLTYLTGGASAAAGMAGKASLKAGVPFTKAAVEIPGSARALEAAGGAIKGAYGKLPENVRQGAQNALVNVKSTMGWLNPANPENAAILAAAESARTNVANASAAGARQALQGLADPEAEELFRVIGNYKRTGEGPGDVVSELLPGSEMANAPYRLADEIAARSGPSPSSVDPIFRPDAYKQVRAPGTTQPVDDLGREVGVAGVAVPTLGGDILETVTKDPSRMSDMVFTPQYADAAAARTLEQAYPLIPTDPRFASGIDVANQALIAPGSGLRGVKTYGEAAETKRAMPRPERAPEERVESDPFTGAVSRTPVVPREAPEVPVSNIEAVSSLMGGPAAQMAKATAESAPRATAPMIKLEDQLAQWNARIDSLGKSPAETARLKEYAGKYLGYIHNDYLQKVKDTGALKQLPGDDPLTMIPQDYAHRRFSDLVPEEDIRLGGQPSSVKARILKEGQNLRDFLNTAEGKKVKLDENLISATSGLAAQAGRIAQRSAIAKGLLKDKFVSLSDEATGGLVGESIAAMEKADPEAARLFHAAWEGTGQPGAIMQALDKANAIFKPAAVYGLVFPRVGGIMKNILSFPAQAWLGGEGRAAIQQLKRTPSTIRNAFQDGIHASFGIQLPKDQLAQGIDLIEQAYKQSGGRAKNATDFLRNNGREDLASAIENGVVEGFVTKEALENSIRDSGWGRKIMGAVGVRDRAKQDRIFDIIDAPAKAFQGGEQYARLGLYKDFLATMTPADAAAKVNSLLYDYSRKTGANRTLRTLIPFAAFQTNAIRQSSQFIAKNPAAGVMLGSLSDADPSSQYPWMSGQTNIPLGASEQGEAQYLTALGVPTEGLNLIPNISGSLADTGQELRSNLLGSAHPLVKTAYSVLSGEDPRFGTAYGSYDRLPGNIEGGALGKTYNQLAGTGLIQPLVTPLNMLGQVVDDRTNAAEKALTLLTGTRIVNVDEDRALRQRIQDYLQNNPDVGQFTAFYQNNPDAATQALIKELNEVKRRQKAKRELAEAVP